MKFSAPYQMEFNCPIDYNNIDEFNVKFTQYSSFNDFEKFVNMYPNHQINVEFAEKNYKVDNIINLCHKYNNIYIRLHSWELKYLFKYQEENINYFFDRTMPVYNYSLLEWVLTQQPKGIYIADDLTYNLPNVYEQCSEKNIELRIVLNKIPTTNLLTSTCPSVQIYRPQDYDFLSKYYAVGEFDCGEEYDWVKAEVLYKKWFIEHKWDSDLEFMNQDLKLPYPTLSIPPELTRLRSVCQHRCTLRAGNLCSKCRRLLLMGYKNADNNLIYSDSEYGLQPLEQIVDSIILSKNNNVE